MGVRQREGYRGRGGRGGGGVPCGRGVIGENKPLRYLPYRIFVNEMKLYQRQSNRKSVGFIPTFGGAYITDYVSATNTGH